MKEGLAVKGTDRRSRSWLGPKERKAPPKGDGILLAQYATMPEIIYQRLREEILTGHMAAGENLNQVELADRFGFSRVPVREALKRLESEGLVVLQPHRGYFVTSLDIDEIEEIFEIRMMLEERAAYYATLHRTAEDVDALHQLLDALDEITVGTSDDVATWAAYNREFHDRLFQPSRRRHLCRFADILRNSVERYIRIDATTAGRMQEAESEHHGIFEAFRGGDAMRVGELSREHCAHTCARLIASLRNAAATSSTENPNG